MASFFGEVLPVTSRAVDDDDDDDDIPESHSSCIIQWNPSATAELEQSTKQCIDCSVVLIGIGPAATAFLRAYILQQETERLGVVCGGLPGDTTDTPNQNIPDDKSCCIYRLKSKPKVVVVQCNTHTSPEQAFSWTSEVLTGLDASQAHVSVLCSASASEYRSDASYGDLRFPLLRALKSSHFKGSPVCPYLEQPNVISGLPAQILTFCQLHKVAAVLYTVFTEAYAYLDSDSIRVFRKVLAATPLKDFITVNPDAEKILGQLVEQHDRQNPLYI